MIFYLKSNKNLKKKKQKYEIEGEVDCKYYQLIPSTLSFESF